VETTSTASSVPKAAAQNDYQFEALVRLQAGAARVAGEIYALLLSGYASGAHARWRTLHEIAVTALFIAQRGQGNGRSGTCIIAS